MPLRPTKQASPSRRELVEEVAICGRLLTGEGRLTMAKNIVVCCDGTGNEIGVNMSNVLKLYRMLEKDEGQLVYYDPGVGTLGQRKTWGRISQNVKGVLGLATGYGLDDDVLGAYRFLAEHYSEGDQVFLFGFSRGSYSVRVLVGFIHLLGLLRSDQLNYVGYAFAAYKRAAMDGEDLSVAWHFRRIVGGRTIPIKFLGVWDTVASVIVPRPDRFYIPSSETLPYTLQNPSVEVSGKQSLSMNSVGCSDCGDGRTTRNSSPIVFRRQSLETRTADRFGSRAVTPTSAAAIRKMRAGCQSTRSAG